MNGIVLMGTTGEFVHFDMEDRARLVSLAVKRSRVPVLVNVSHSTHDGSVYLAEQAAKCGAAGLLVMPPYFYRYSQAALRGYFRHFIEEAGANLPVYLYHIPAYTSPIEARTAIDLLETGLFAGIKDSSGDWENFRALREAALERPFDLFIGHDRLFAAARSAGAEGIISGVAAAIPELLVALERALVAGDQVNTAALRVRLEEFMDRIEAFPATFGIKEAASARGLKTGPTAIPLGAGPGERMREFREWFRAWWQEVQQECGQ